MFVALSIHLLFSFLPHFLPDEPFYITIPYRLFNGDSLVQDEWHLSQFSSFFTYLPVSLWLTIKGSADGLIVFLRLVYLSIHTAAATVIYRLFRKFGYWAVSAALIYFIQTPYKIYAISYNSMFALFLLLFSISLYLIYRNNSKKLHFFVGVSFSACCICNPFFAVTLLLYPIIGSLRYIRKKHKIKRSNINSLSSAQGEKQENRTKQEFSAELVNEENYDRFFCKQAIRFFLLGIAAVAAAGLIFFFSTGGTISAVVKNLRNMIDSSEYGIVSDTILAKIERIAIAAKRLTLNNSYLLPLLFVVLIFDKRRKRNSHRLVYLAITIPLSLLCIIGMRFSTDIAHTLFLSLPFSLVSIVCYILTERKNKPLFFLTWCPCGIAALINLFVSNTLFAAAGFVLAVSNATGVIFAHDLFFELCSEQQIAGKTTTETIGKTRVRRSSRTIICTALVLQLVFYLYVIQFGQPIPNDPVIVSDGPYAGMLMSKERNANYNSSLSDLDLIQERSNEDDPVLIVSYQSWMYLYLQRPIATYTTWYDAFLDRDALNTYYSANSEKVPKYIYLVNSDDIEPLGIHIDNVRYCLNTINSMFDYEMEELTKGLLLTVTEYHRN